MNAMVPQWIIEKKRDGKVLSEDEIRFIIEGYTAGSIPDYQMAALAMAIFFRGMADGELAVLTDAMMHSGEVVDTSGIARYKADKHSTGGVGDKVSLILAPLVACCGIAVPMISGRGLGITGGTLDKMESIEGYRTHLEIDEFLSVVDRCGCSIIGQTQDLAPADKKLYALRDVTATVPSIPLISASIMSKKLAEGTDGLVLDVKWGRGAFMKTEDDARQLANVMVGIGHRMQRGMTAVLTGMNQPLGRTAGNAVEVEETVRSLQGSGPTDLMSVTLRLSAHMLLLAGKADDVESAEQILQGHVDSGRAFEKLKEMVALHGGEVGVLDDPMRLPQAALRHEYMPGKSGYVTAVDADRIGRACLALGAGRQAVEDAVDHAVGITDLVKVGEHLEKQDVALVLLANDQAKLDAALHALQDAIIVEDAPPVEPPLIGETIRPGGET